MLIDSTPLDTNEDTLGDLAPCLHAAMRCLRTASSNDHQYAKELRSRSCGEHSRDHKSRARLLRVKEKQTEARSAELARESR